MTVQDIVRRTYGGWHKPTTPGILPRLGTIGSALAIGVLIVGIMLEAFAGWKVALVWLVAAEGAVVVPLLYRDRAGRNGWQLVGTKAAWLQGRHARQHVFIGPRQGVVAFGATTLPGLLAESRLVEGEDGRGDPFALVHVRKSSHYTVLISTQPDGSALVDEETVDEWVARHGVFLSALAHEPGLEGASATVETAPDPGNRLVAEVTRLTPEGTPDLTKRILAQKAATFPRGAASITGHIALTYTAKRPKVDEREPFAARGGDKAPRGVRSDGEMVAHIGQRLPGMLRLLNGAGIGEPKPMTARQVAEMVRIAYDPGSAADIDGDRSRSAEGEVDWTNAGPVGAHETWSAYRTNASEHITWEMTEAPTGEVYSRVLEDIIAPTDAVARKRVTILYRPHDPASSAAIADRDVRTAHTRATMRKGERRAHDDILLAMARKTAQEEAGGAGLVRFSILITATVVEPGKLAEAAETVTALARASRLRIRRCYGAQAAAFTGALGVGIIPSAHIAVPEVAKEWL